MDRERRGGLPVIRRIVTACNERGLSYIAEDGPTPAVITAEGRPGYRNMNIWRTSGRIDDADTITEHRGVLPPAGGVIIRAVDIPAMASRREDQTREAQAVFAAMFPDAKHDPQNARSAGMHVTDTIDFAIVLEGEIVAIMDIGETTMRRGDVLVQRGTNHAWENRTDKITRMLFVLCDAAR